MEGVRLLAAHRVVVGELVAAAPAPLTVVLDVLRGGQT